MNCRNYEYYTVCDINMCCSMDLSMYSNVYEDCVMNPGGDKWGAGWGGSRIRYSIKYVVLIRDSISEISP